MGPRFWKWHGWDWREPHDWQQPRLPDWLPFRPLAQRGSALLLAAALALVSRPLLPWSPASPPLLGCPSCTCRKFALGLRAQRSAFPSHSLRRACASTRPNGEWWLRAGTPPGDKRPGTPNFKNLRLTACRASSNIHTLSSSSLGRARGYSRNKGGEQMFARHRTCRGDARNFLFGKDTQSAKRPRRSHRQETGEMRKDIDVLLVAKQSE